MKQQSRFLLTLVLACTIGLAPLFVFAESDQQLITEILSQTEKPDGIVFELIGDDGGDYLRQALTRIEAYKTRLRERFPGIEIAVVSHGAEQFGLTSDNQSTNKASHQSVQRLIDADIPVHICETHASWKNVTAEDFPSYISPTPQGPIQIDQYE